MREELDLMQRPSERIREINSTVAEIACVFGHQGTYAKARLAHCMFWLLATKMVTHLDKNQGSTDVAQEYAGSEPSVKLIKAAVGTKGPPS